MLKDLIDEYVNFLLNVFLFLIVIVALATPFVGGLIYLMNWGSQLNCYSRWEGSKYEVRYSFWGGCNVKVNGTWLPEGSVKVLQ